MNLYGIIQPFILVRLFVFVKLNETSFLKLLRKYADCFFLESFLTTWEFMHNLFENNLGRNASSIVFISFLALPHCSEFIATESWISIQLEPPETGDFELELFCSEMYGFERNIVLVLRGLFQFPSATFD